MSSRRDALRGGRREQSGPQDGGIAFCPYHFLIEIREMIRDQVDYAISQSAHLSGR